MTQRRVIVALAAQLAGCGAATAGGGGPASDGATGAAEFPPKAAFRAHVAKLLQVPPDEINGGANSAARAREAPHTRRGALPYVMWHLEDFNHAIRGWVTEDGTVITPILNVGLLLAAEGVWDHPPKQPLEDLARVIAEDLVWTYGPGTELVTMAIWGLELPSLTIAPDGSGRFRFFTNDHGGAQPWGDGAPPDVYWKNDVAITADHRATLTRTRFETTAGR